jgi:predicted dinucleotide-binding enzyme
VAAALQNVPAHRLRQNIGGTIDADVMVFVDDPDLIDQVVELIQAGGMRAYYAGGLDDAIVSEGLTAVLIHMNRYYGIKTASITIHGIDGEPG